MSLVEILCNSSRAENPEKRAKTATRVDQSWPWLATVGQRPVPKSDLGSRNTWCRPLDNEACLTRLWIIGLAQKMFRFFWPDLKKRGELMAVILRQLTFLHLILHLFGYSLGLRTMWARSELSQVMRSRLGWVSSTSQLRLEETLVIMFSDFSHRCQFAFSPPANIHLSRWGEAHRGLWEQQWRAPAWTDNPAPGSRIHAICKFNMLNLWSK